jgi:hypothetical protein
MKQHVQEPLVTIELIAPAGIMENVVLMVILQGDE